MAHIIDMSDIENVVVTNRVGRQTRKDTVAPMATGGQQQQHHVTKQPSQQRNALVNLVNHAANNNANFRVQPSRAAKQHTRLQNASRSSYQPSANTGHAQPSTSSFANNGRLSLTTAASTKSTTTSTTRSAAYNNNATINTRSRQQQKPTKSTFVIYEDSPESNKKPSQAAGGRAKVHKALIDKNATKNNNRSSFQRIINNNDDSGDDMEVSYDKPTVTTATSSNAFIANMHHRPHHQTVANAIASSAAANNNNKKFKAFGEITNVMQQQNNVSNSIRNFKTTMQHYNNNNMSSISISSSVSRSHYDIYDDDDDDEDDDIPSTFNDLDISFEGRRMSTTTIVEHQQLQQQHQKQHIPTVVAVRQHRRSLINEQIVLLDVYSLPEYRDDILTYGKEAEQRYMAKANYMERQSDINHSMRSILVDWLVEVADEYKLKRETFFLAVNYIDRFLSMMSVIRCRLQLLGAAAMFIAAKYEEIYPPDVAEFVYITDDTYNMKQVLQMEQAILKTLNFLVAAPTPNFFCCDLLDRLGAYKKGANGVCDDGGRWNSLAMYMLETTTVFGDSFLKFPPSMISTSCVALSHYLINRTGCMSELSRITSYTVFTLAECLNSIFTTLHNSSNVQQQAVRAKYNSEKYHFVSSLELPETLSLDVL